MRLRIRDSFKWDKQYVLRTLAFKTSGPRPTFDASGRAHTGLRAKVKYPLSGISGLSHKRFFRPHGRSSVLCGPGKIPCLYLAWTVLLTHHTTVRVLKPKLTSEAVGMPSVRILQPA